MKRQIEVLWWSLFSAGGVFSALCVPGLILSTAFLLPTNDPAAATERYNQVLAVVTFWPVRLVLIAVIALAAFHCAHRIRHILMDIGLRHYDRILVPLCYLAASALSIAAALILITRF